MTSATSWVKINKWQDMEPFAGKFVAIKTTDDYHNSIGYAYNGALFGLVDSTRQTFGGISLKDGHFTGVEEGFNIDQLQPLNGTHSYWIIFDHLLQGRRAISLEVRVPTENELLHIYGAFYYKKANFNEASEMDRARILALFDKQLKTVSTIKRLFAGIIY